ncbi:MAG: hypothetical protein PVI90_07455 [Desulfobacteraceae bacterium]|jgi:uncharacterized delta-60 repeat protein
MNVFIRFKRYLAIMLGLTSMLGKASLIAGAGTFQLGGVQFDSEFGENGVVRTNFYYGIENDEGAAILLQKDGRIVLTGSLVLTMMPEYYQYSQGAIALARLNKDGSLDETFGDNGMTLTLFTDEIVKVTDAVVDYSGNILVAGYINCRTDDFLLVRYSPDGELDYTFGENGIVITDFNERDDRAYRLKIDHMGKIILSGESSNVDGTIRDTALARYNTDGSKDMDFGTYGTIVADLFNEEDAAHDLVVDSAGKILITGYTGIKKKHSNIILARFNYDGSQDATFGDSGRVKFKSSNFEIGTQIKLLPKGRLLVLGTTRWQSNSNKTDLCLIRCLWDGSFDQSFGNGGNVKSDFGGSELGIALFGQAGGKVLVAMKSFISSDDKINYDGSEELVLALYNWNGTLDKDFGDNGFLKTDFFEDHDHIKDAVMPLGGKIVVGGFVRKNGYTKNDFAVAQYTLQ